MKLRFSDGLHFLIGAAVLMTPGVAAAGWPSYCTSGPAANGHYYGIILSSPPGTDGNRGDQVALYTTELFDNDGCASYDFVTHELWYGLDSNANYWIEVGFRSGDTYSGDCVSEVDFWADYRNGGGYHEHYPGNAWNLNEWYNAEIAYANQSCTWNVYLGGLNLGTSTSNCPGTGRNLQAGIEATNTGLGLYDDGYMDDWYQEGSNNVWTAWESLKFSCNETCDIGFTSGSGTETHETDHGPF